MTWRRCRASSASARACSASMIVGGWWGCGHTLSLLLTGLLVTLLGFDLRKDHLCPVELLVAACSSHWD
ncbi:MAG: hypothetical protein J2P21_01805 [Chloracidobacterium sp.]|nr:hypothetical protein [Chloracidobacterium sp.]